MMINYQCPKCGETMESPTSLAGSEDECPRCQAHVQIPQQAGFSVPDEGAKSQSAARTSPVIGKRAKRPCFFCGAAVPEEDSSLKGPIYQLIGIEGSNALRNLITVLVGGGIRDRYPNRSS
jgi:endogenous inhibitor of DNA gyrase (YacG/DUF329 family)